MLDRWRLARSGEGQIVTLLGKAGIGKSRLVEAVHESVSGEPHTRIHLQCSPYHRDSALYPVIQHLGRAARFVAEDSTAIRIEKLGALFAGRAPSDATTIPLLAELANTAVADAGATQSGNHRTPRRRDRSLVRGWRFWPFGVGSIDIPALKRDRGQLFAEAVKRFREGEKWWPQAEFERTDIRPEQDARYEGDPWQQPIADYIATVRPAEVRILDIAQRALGFDTSRVGTHHQRRIAAVLTALKWRRPGRRDERGRLYEPASGP